MRVQSVRLDPFSRAWRAGAIRGGTLFGIWLVIAGGAAADLLPGIVAAALATWTSFVLSPPRTAATHLRPLSLLGLLLRFAWGSFVAGIDIARRAFGRGPPFRPGYVVYRTGLPDGDSRNLFMCMTSLMPGTLCVATDATDALVFHCLDVEQPVLAELAEAEARLVAALGATSDYRQAVHAVSRVTGPRG